MINPAVMVGIALVTVALVGGGYASYRNIRAARGPKERAFVTRVCIAGWVLILSMPPVVYLLQTPWNYLAAGAYLVAVPLLIYRWATLHQLIRIVEARERDDHHPAHAG
jgi:hypothetical protein